MLGDGLGRGRRSRPQSNEVSTTYERGAFGALSVASGLTAALIVPPILVTALLVGGFGGASLSTGLGFALAAIAGGNDRLDRSLADVLDRRQPEADGLALHGLRPGPVPARALAELDDAPPLLTAKGDLKFLDKPLIAATMFGVTTPCVNVARETFEKQGFEVLVFHATGYPVGHVGIYIGDGMAISTLAAVNSASDRFCGICASRANVASRCSSRGRTPLRK